MESENYDRQIERRALKFYKTMCGEYILVEGRHSHFQIFNLSTMEEYPDSTTIIDNPRIRGVRTIDEYRLKGWRATIWINDNEWIELKGLARKLPYRQIPKWLKNHNNIRFISFNAYGEYIGERAKLTDKGK